VDERAAGVCTDTLIDDELDLPAKLPKQAQAQMKKLLLTLYASTGFIVVDGSQSNFFRWGIR
jgi:hypothetical protein